MREGPCEDGQLGHPDVGSRTRGKAESVSADVSPGQGGPRAQAQLDGLGWNASFCHLLAGDLGKLLGICASDSPSVKGGDQQ